MGYLNAIWLGDANAMTLRPWTFRDSSPSDQLNDPDVISVRVASQVGELVGKPVFWEGEDQTALLSQARHIIH